MAALPSFIPLDEAAQRLKKSKDEIRQLAEDGKINAAMIDDRLVVSERDIYRMMPTPKEKLPEYQAVKHLKGKAVGVNEAARKYGIHNGTISEWTRKGFIAKLGEDGNRYLLDEADVAYCKAIYEKTDGGAGKRIFNADGTPWKPKERIKKNTSGRKRLSRSELERRREKGIQMLQAGKSQIEIARKLEVSEAAVSIWKKQMDEGDSRPRSLAA